MLERTIEKKVCEYARSFDIITYKFSSPARVSVPDRLFIYKGRYWFVEFKRKGKRPTTAQIREHDKLRAAGAIVIVVDDYLSGTIIVNIMVAGNSLSLELIIKFLNDVENISTS